MLSLDLIMKVSFSLPAGRLFVNTSVSVADLWLVSSKVALAKCSHSDVDAIL
jgi:hypothetical protein